MTSGFDGIDAGLIVMGAFYAFAGIVAARAAVMSNILDEALSKISMKPTPPVERHLFWWLFSSSVVVFLGGVALMLRSEPALWLFVLSAAGQAFYLMLLAPRYFDRDDPPDAQGRSKTTNAFYVYLVATALVAFAASSGRLRGLDKIPSAELYIGLAAVAAYATMVGRWMWPQRDRTDAE